MQTLPTKARWPNLSVSKKNKSTSYSRFVDGRNDNAFYLLLQLNGIITVTVMRISERTRLSALAQWLVMLWIEIGVTDHLGSIDQYTYRYNSRKRKLMESTENRASLEADVQPFPQDPYPLKWQAVALPPCYPIGQSGSWREGGAENNKPSCASQMSGNTA